MTNVLGIASLLLMGSGFYFFAKGNLTSNEQVLFSILVTLGSSVLSWVISHYYAEKSHQETVADIKKENQSNLKIYASKAAEKVRNLSTQLVGLVTYLNEELNSEAYDTAEENLRAKEERIYSAIHIIKTLKSINDGSLSDWSGVIPEEIEEIAEEERENFERINNIIYDFDQVKTDQSDSVSVDTESQDIKINTLAKKIDLLLGSLTGVSPKPFKSSLKKERVEKDCPECGKIVVYRQKPIATSRKGFRCSHCEAKLMSQWNLEGGFKVSKDPRKFVDDNISAMNRFREPIDEDLIQVIKNRLPPQPWPKGTGTRVANELNISRSKVKNIINILISRGVFSYQIDGKLTSPEVHLTKKP